MLEPAPTLARHLEDAAGRTPRAPALIVPGQEFDFAGLRDEALRRPASLAGIHTPYRLAAGSTGLALAAYASSLAGRPFWPANPGLELPNQRHPGQTLPGQGLPATPPEMAMPCRSSIHAGLREIPPGEEKTAPGTVLIISTSGSEGQAKAVMLSAANLEAAAAASASRLPLAPGDLWLDCLPLFHIGGLSILWRCARAGAAVLLHEGFDADAVARDLAARRVTHISLVPAMLARLLEAGATSPAHLRHVLVGGAALSRPLYERAVAAGWPLFPTWGMSETAAQVATFDPADGPWHEGLVGRPLPGNEVAIGPEGRIHLRGPQVMQGYLNPAGDAGSGLNDGWLVTGDLGRLDDRDRLTILGRADDMLVSGGSNVHPLAVESCLAACPGVADVAVAGQPDPVWGDRVVALVAGEADDETILAWGRQHLPSAARPREIIRLPQLPRNAAGKLDRTALRICLSEHLNACSGGHPGALEHSPGAAP